MDSYYPTITFFWQVADSTCLIRWHFTESKAIKKKHCYLGKYIYNQIKMCLCVSMSVYIIQFMIDILWYIQKNLRFVKCNIYLKFFIRNSMWKFSKLAISCSFSFGNLIIKRFTFLTKYENKLYLIFIFIVIGTFVNCRAGYCCFTRLICLGMRLSWWRTYIFFHANVKAKYVTCRRETVEGSLCIAGLWTNQSSIFWE